MNRREKKQTNRWLRQLWKPIPPGPVMAGWLKMAGVFAAIERRQK